METRTPPGRLRPPALDPRFSWLLIDPSLAPDSALPRAMRKTRAARGRLPLLAALALLAVAAARHLL